MKKSRWSSHQAVYIFSFFCLALGLLFPGNDVSGQSPPKTISGPAAADNTFTNTIGQKFVLIPPGNFISGSPTDELGRSSDEGRRQVTISRSFYLQTTEVTQAQWRAIMDNNPSHFKTCGDDCPVENVSWDDVQAYISRLNAKEGTTKYRLPTAAEWEYAARAGATTSFANGNIKETECGHDPSLDLIGWYCGNSNKSTHPVARKQANAWGLYDLSGNVWEWCQDWYALYPTDYHLTDPPGPASGSFRIYRGGSWDSKARYCRSAFRLGNAPGTRSDTVGFRLAIRGRP
ncbi:MAG: formylglycine-generating enzyme family protein [Thermodesulfobacteriota bacterium]